MSIKVSENFILEQDYSDLISYGKEESSQSHLVTHRKYPQNIKRWTDFEELVNNQYIDERPIHQFFRPDYFHIKNETDLCTFLIIILRTTFQKSLFEPENKCLHSNVNLRIGTPDILYMNEQDFESKDVTDNDKTELIIEVKTKFVLDKIKKDDLVDHYERYKFDKKKDPVTCCIIQIYTYMIRNKKRYGVLTSFEKTWFFKLEKKLNLKVRKK